MIILASASPRRRDLLQQIGLDFLVAPAHIDETPHPGEVPGDFVRRLAEEKARAVAASRSSLPVLAADTTVECEGVTLNKPENAEQARSMLRQLSDRVHSVHTGVAVCAEGRVWLHVETTLVRFTSILPEELEEYIASGDPMDKAGAYGIQGYAARWVRQIEGDFFNVVGLPLAATLQLLRGAGVAGTAGRMRNAGK